MLKMKIDIINKKTGNSILEKNEWASISITKNGEMWLQANPLAKCGVNEQISKNLETKDYKIIIND